MCFFFLVFVSVFFFSLLFIVVWFFFFFFSSRRRHTRCLSDWSSDVCSSDLPRSRLAARDPRVRGGRRSAVASHFVHRAFVVMDRFHHPLDHRVEKLAGLLGIAVREQLHRSFKVGEQHGDLLALAFESRLGGEDLLGQVLRGMASGEMKRGSLGGASSGCAHSGQNFAVVEAALPQLGHVRARGAAHSSQNFAPVRFSCRHFEHFIRAPSGVVGSRVTRVASRAAHNNIRPPSLLLHGAALVGSESRADELSTASTAALLPLYPQQRTKSVVPWANGAVCHVWTAPAVQEESDVSANGRVRSCIRPVVAAALATGHDVIRKSGPNQKHALVSRVAHNGLPDQRSTVSHHVVFTPANRERYAESHMALLPTFS